MLKKEAEIVALTMRLDPMDRLVDSVTDVRRRPQVACNCTASPSKLPPIPERSMTPLSIVELG